MHRCLQYAGPWRAAETKRFTAAKDYAGASRFILSESTIALQLVTCSCTLSCPWIFDRIVDNTLCKLMKCCEYGTHVLRFAITRAQAEVGAVRLSEQEVPTLTHDEHTVHVADLKCARDHPEDLRMADTHRGRVGIREFVSRDQASSIQLVLVQLISLISLRDVRWQKRRPMETMETGPTLYMYRYMCTHIMNLMVKFYRYQVGPTQQQAQNQSNRTRNGHRGWDRGAERDLRDGARGSACGGARSRTGCDRRQV